MNKKKNRKNLIINCLLVLFALIAVLSGIYIFMYYYGINKSSKNFEELKEEIRDDYLDENSEEIYVEAEDNTSVYKKYESIYNMNTDFIGWLTIDGTVIDYPVMYTPDDEEYYLRRDFNKEYSTAGTLFVAADSVPVGDTTDNIIIYGHNMKAGTMFHDLLKYEDEDFYKEHKYITFDTISEEGTYEVIAAFRTEIYSEDDTEHYNFYDFTDAASAEEFNEYVNNAKSNTPYIISESAVYGDKLLTLSTCAYHADEGRFIVVAKKIETDGTE